MRILYASERPPFPFFLGGAARSAHHVMSILSRDLGVECLAIGSKDNSRESWGYPRAEDFQVLDVADIEPGEDTIRLISGYRVKLLGNFWEALPAVLGHYAPDVVWTQLEGVEAIARIARRQGFKVILYLRDAEDPPDVLKRLAKENVLFVCNSNFMAERVKSLTGRRTEFIYPSFDFRLDVVGDPDGYITMVNPHQVKGIDTFVDIAKRMPEERFLLVESWPLADADLATLNAMLARLPNVRFSRRVPDITEIYRQSKVVIAPSLWEEAFGRVVIEAQACGIPVIASRRGGLPESVGDGGFCVDDYRNPETWVTAIREILGDKARYREISAKAREHATSELFSSTYAARRFLDICERHIKASEPWSWRLRRLTRRLSGGEAGV